MMLTKSDFHDYQNTLSEHIINKNGCGGFAEMGLGKTGAALWAIYKLIMSCDIKKVLIIAPVRVASLTWPDEFDKWNFANRLKHTVLKGPPKKREALLKEGSHVFTISCDLVTWITSYFKPSQWPFDMVVIDESSTFKNPSSNRFRSLKKMRHKIDRLACLTGSPVGNSMLNLWSQVYLMDQGERLGKTFTAFKNTYFNSDYMGYEWTLKEGAQAAIYAKIEDICLSMRAKDYLKLPGKIDNFIKVDLSDRLKKHYKEFERELVLQMDPDSISASNAAVLSGKLLQFANGAIYFDDTKDFEILHDEKIEALRGIIEDAQGTPLLVPYYFQHDLSRLLKAFPKAETFKDDTVTRWNNGEIQLLLAHPMSMGHGLNMQKIKAQIVWFSLPWSLELYEQTNARINRQGQKSVTIINHLVCKGTIDEAIINSLYNKDMTQKALLKALKIKHQQKEGAQ